ncbi:ATP synthase F1 subunit gamma [Candidatus Woesebacteria bacterium]|nr:ATP synthase F1 subunit gamma [Candidatus Woesebacteria bacterium]
MNLRTVRKKIKSIKNVKKITKAMQMVSAVKMRKAQQREYESRPYRDGLSTMIARLSHSIDNQMSGLLQIDTSAAQRDLVIIVSSNKGLAGAFNLSVFRYVLKRIDASKTDFVVVGNKAVQFMGSLKDTDIKADFSSASPVLQASALFDYVLEQFQTGTYTTVSIVYHQFISTLKSDVVQKTLLPFDHLYKEVFSSNEGEEVGREYLIEPDPKHIVEELLKSYVEQTIRGALISSEAVEHSARMMAMKSATENASDLIYGLTLLSNRLRQEKITNELLDMVTAKESVESV